MTTSPATEFTPTPSLRRRVTLTVLALIAVLLLVVGVAVDLALGVQLRRDVHDCLVAAADRADKLSAAGMPPDALAAELTGATSACGSSPPWRQLRRPGDRSEHHRRSAPPTPAAPPG